MSRGITKKIGLLPTLPDTTLPTPNDSKLGTKQLGAAALPAAKHVTPATKRYHLQGAERVLGTRVANDERPSRMDATVSNHVAPTGAKPDGNGTKKRLRAIDGRRRTSQAKAAGKEGIPCI